MANTTHCPYCGGDMTEDAAICPSCGGPAKKADAIAGVQPYFVSQADTACPNCNARVGSGDIVCVHCGTNLLTGQKIVKAPESRKTDLRGFVKAMKVAGVVLLIACCAAILIALALFLFRDPVGNARRAAQGGNLEQASQMLSEYLQGAPNDLDAQFLLGQVYWQAQRYDRASEVFESVARQGGTRDREAAMLALLATERMPGNEHRQRQIALLRSLVQQRYPDDAELLTLLALLQGVEGEYRGQREAVEALVILGAAPPALPGLSRALTHDLESATIQLQRALDAHPEEDAVAVALGFVHKMRGQEDAALAILERVREASPEVEALVKLQMGALLLAREQYGRALPLLTAAKSARPDDMRVAFLHAVCLQQNKLWEEALVAFETIATGTSEFAGLAALEMAVIYLEQGNVDRAASFVRRAGEAGLTTARQSTIQGRVHAALGEMTQAEQAYVRALSMEGDYPAARLELGLILINRGAIEEGLREIDRYLELAAENPIQYRANEIEVLVTQIKQTRQ